MDPKSIPLKYESLEGFLSAKQLSEHHGLYAGYVKKTNEIREKLKTVDISTANGTYSDLRSLKDGETFGVNGYKLHERYFDNMAQNGSKPSDKLIERINAQFGSFEEFAKMFAACGLAVRGWVVLAWDLDEEALRIYAADAHNDGAVWAAIPLLVLDIYEHAYFLDYATGRKAYVEGFMQNIDWDVVNARVEKWVK